MGEARRRMDEDGRGGIIRWRALARHALESCFVSSVILLIRVRIILARKRELERIGFGADINFARSTAASPKRMSRTPTLNYIRSHDFFSDNIDRNPTNIVDFSKIPATTFFLFFYPPPSAIREQSYYYAFGIKKASRGISSSNS